MDVYKRMYLHLFNKVTDALSAIAGGNEAVAAEILRSAQADCEDMFITAAPPPEKAANPAFTKKARR